MARQLDVSGTSLSSMTGLGISVEDDRMLPSLKASSRTRATETIDPACRSNLLRYTVDRYIHAQMEETGKTQARCMWICDPYRFVLQTKCEDSHYAERFKQQLLLLTPDICFDGARLCAHLDFRH